MNFNNELANKIVKIIQARGMEPGMEIRVEAEITKMIELGVLEDIYVIYQKVEASPGLRGSENVLNSLVGYLLGLTTCKPSGDFKIEKRRTYGRSGFPDIDMDFDYARRHEIETYLRQKYGYEYVGQIGTIQTLKARAALRRVIKVLDPDKSIIFDKNGLTIKSEQSQNFALQNEILRTLPSLMKREDGTLVRTLEEAYKEYGEFRRYMDEYPEVFRVAKRMEGGISAFGTHAAGLLVSPEPLKYIAPLHVTRGIIDDSGPPIEGQGPEEKKATVATQFSMSEVESLGLIKFDILGLSTKTAINLACKLIKENHGVEIDLANLPLKDRATLKLLTSGETDGCFQLENYGMKQTLRTIEIDSFDDLVVAIAMYRPGPKDYIQEFARRKRNPGMVRYVHPIVERYTKNTYGIISYQEQAMQIFVDLAGLTPSEGYVFIKGAAKKKPELFQSMKQKFIDGASRKANKEVAESVWGQMEPFQGYAFNKSLQSSEKIITSEKDISIQELYNRKQRGEALPSVYDRNGNPIEIVDVYDHGVIPCWKVMFSDGGEHKCTLDHKFSTSFGALPLRKIINDGLAIHKNVGVLNANKKRLGLCLRGSYSQSPEFCDSHTRLRTISDEQKEIRVPRMPAEIHSPRLACSQKRVPEMEGCEIPTLLGIEQEDIQKILEESQVQSRVVAELPREDVHFGINLDIIERHGQGSPFCFDEEIKQNAQSFISTKPSRDGNKDFRKTRNSTAKIGKAGVLAKKSPGRILRKVLQANEAKRMAFKSRNVSQADFVPAGFQVQPNDLFIKLYYSFSPTPDRFFESGEKSFSGIRRRPSLQKRLAKGLASSGKKRRRARQCNDQQRISCDSHFLRHLVISLGTIQSAAIPGIVDDCCLLSKQRSCQEDWEEVQVVSIEYVGLQQCYDLEVDSPDHLYCLSSGIVNSNSHACSYAYESWKTAYLKAHFPLEFMAARLTVEGQRRNFDDVKKYENDAARLGIKILSPDLNRSKLHYAIVGENQLMQPLIIKGIGDKAAEEIIANQPYKGSDLVESFSQKVGKAVNSKVVEALCDAKMFGNIRKSKVVEAFETIKRDKNKTKGKQTGDIFG